jgi:hypothetical protein
MVRQARRAERVFEIIRAGVWSDYTYAVRRNTVRIDVCRPQRRVKLLPLGCDALAAPNFDSMKYGGTPAHIEVGLDQGFDAILLVAPFAGDNARGI